MPLKLTPDQTDRLVKLIDEKKTEGQQILSGIQGDYQNIVGANWLGGTAISALDKQEEFAGVWQRLSNILDDLQTGIAGTKNILTGQDDDDRSQVNAISADSGGMNFHRI